MVVNYENNYSCLGDFHIAWSFSCKFSRIVGKMRVEKGRALMGRRKVVNEVLSVDFFSRMN